MTQVTIYQVGDDYAMTVYRGGEIVTVEKWPESKAALLDSILEYVNGIKSPRELMAEKAFQIAEATATDEQMLEIVDLIPEWKEGETLKAGQVRRKGNEVFRADGKASMKSLNGKKKDKVVEWSDGQIYKFNQLVRYKDGNIYKSKHAENIWSPESFHSGWELQDGH